MYSTALIIFNLLITVYVVFALAILYHLKKYRWPGDLNGLSAVVFVAGSIFLVGLAAFFFINFPWALIS